jgi:hypothetical protein
VTLAFRQTTGNIADGSQLRGVVGDDDDGDFYSVTLTFRQTIG